MTDEPSPAEPPTTQGGRDIRFTAASRAFVSRDGQARQAVADINLHIPARQFVAIVGPSGCGKSTLLRLADGLIVPDSGSVTVGGTPPRPGPDIGVAFQNFRLVPWRSILDNVAFPLEVMGLPIGQRRALALDQLRRVGLDSRAEDYPAQLSGGMRQRAALARALVGQPDVLLMDEPFASLDAQTRELMQEDLMRLYEQTRPTVLFVTHSVDEALLLGDRVVVMGAGRIMADIDVAFPRPRSVAAIGGTDRYLALRESLWRQIRQLVLDDPTSAFYRRGQEDIRGPQG